MPGHSKTTYWTSVDFDSEDEGDQSSNQKSQRIYMDPWDLDNYTFVRRSMNGEPAPPEQMSSFAGEPVSASFYYVPTKSYESDEEDLTEPGPYRRQSVAVQPTVDLAPEYAGERRKSKMYFDEHLNEVPNAGYDMAHYERKMSRQHPDEFYYQQQYGPEAHGPSHRMQPPPGAPLAVGTRRRSVASHAEYVPPQIKHDRMSVQGRYPDSFDRYAYESIMADYNMDEWERNSDLPVKPPPENFHFSRYGHLKIDYSCSWNSLDRLIRNQ